MHLYRYPFGNAVGDFVIIGTYDDKVLIYSVTNERFFMAVIPVVEACEPLRPDAGITIRDLIDAYEKLQEWTEVREYVKEDPGHRSLMDACRYFYETEWKASEEVDVGSKGSI